MTKYIGDLRSDVDAIVLVTVWMFPPLLSSNIIVTVSNSTDLPVSYSRAYLQSAVSARKKGLAPHIINMVWRGKECPDSIALL